MTSVQATELDRLSGFVNGVAVEPFEDLDLDSLEPGDILRDTEPLPVDGIAGRYTCVIPLAWRVMYAFGGTTMAAAIRAAVAELGRPDLEVVGAEATYCAAVPCGAMGIHVEVLRGGRNGAQALVRLWSLPGDDPDPSGAVGNDLVVAVVLGRRSDTPLEFTGAMAPEVPDPLDCPGRETMPDSPFNRIPYHRQTDFRVAMGGFRLGESSPPADPEAASWFRFQKSPMLPDGCWDPAVLAVPGDILGPAVHAGLGGEVGFFFVISLQIGLKFVRDVETEWVLQHTRAQSARSGFASGTAELFDADRRLVAVATQTAVLRPVEFDPGATDA